VDGAIRCYGRCLFAWDLAGERGTKFIRIALTVSQLEVARGDLDAAEEWAHCGTIRARNFSLYALEADSMWERARLRALAAEQGAGGEASRLALRLGRAAADIYIAERAVGSLGSLDLEIATWAVRVGEPAEALRHARRAARIASAVAPAHVGLCRDVIADIEACARGERPARATGVKQRRPRLDAEDWSVMAPSVQRFDVERLYSDNRELDLSLPG
jgi:hypothetical protein